MPISTLIEQDDRAWLDWRWCWLADRLRTERIRAAQVLGGIQAFARSDQPVTEEQMQALAEKIAAMLGITGIPVQLIVGSTETVFDNDELYERCEAAKTSARMIVIGIDRNDLADPQVCAYFMMKRIICDYLVISGWLTEDDEDGWEVAEIAAVQLGVGVILANNTLVQSTVTFGLTEWGRSFAGTILSEELLAYALARFAYLRRDTPPDWQHVLRRGPRKTFRACFEEFDTEPPPERAQRPEGVLSPQQRHLQTLDEEEDWSAEELAPANPQDHEEGNIKPVFCRSCAYNVAHLPAGACPDCGTLFDPDDLRTVSIDRPKIISESTQRRISLAAIIAKKTVKWLLILFVVSLIISIIVATI